MTSYINMGKQRSGVQSKRGKARGAGENKEQAEEDVAKRSSWLPFTLSVAVLGVAILAGSGYLLYSGPAKPTVGWTPYTVTGNVTVKLLPFATAEFAQMCSKHAVPLLLRNSVITQWQATDLWTPEYLQNKLSSLSGVYENSNRWFGPYFDKSKPLTSSAVRVNKYKTDVSLTSSEFFHRIQNPVKGQHLYFTGGIEQLGGWAEHQIQPISELLRLNAKRSSINVWMGQPHVIAHCHYDGYHNFYAQLYGTKKFTLFRPTNWPGLYPYPFLHPSHAQAQVNLSRRSDSERDFPLVNKVEAVEVVLEPGDLLYMPPLWFHEVESLNVSISVNVWTDSKQTELVEKIFSIPLPLSDGRLKWRSEKARTIATSLFIHRILENICNYHVCADVHTDKFVAESVDSSKEMEKSFSDKVIYFVHRLWSARYRTLMERRQLPGALGNGEERMLCEGGLTEVDKEFIKEAERVLEGARFGAYVTEIAELVRALPEDTWELWVGNFIEYIVIATGAVENAKFVGLFLKTFASCVSV